MASSSAEAEQAAPPPNPPHKGEGFRRLKLRPDAITRARELRKTMTEAEKALWTALREKLPHGRWRHQVPFGPYTADFCSHRYRLVIEADGSQHAEQIAYDDARTSFLKAEGYRTLRFWNTDILTNIDGVVTLIASSMPEARR